MRSSSSRVPHPVLGASESRVLDRDYDLDSDIEPTVVRCRPSCLLEGLFALSERAQPCRRKRNRCTRSLRGPLQARSKREFRIPCVSEYTTGSLKCIQVHHISYGICEDTLTV